MEKTKSILVKLSFLWDDCPDTGEYKIKVQQNVSDQEVYEKLRDAHDYLDLIGVHDYLDCDETSDLYGVNGRVPSVLLNYVCKENGWEWSNIDYDIELD